jgi:hypothetical protein
VRRGCAQPSRRDDIERYVQRLGDFGSNDNAAACQAQNQRVAGAVPREALGESRARVLPIPKEADELAG